MSRCTVCNTQIDSTHTDAVKIKLQNLSTGEVIVAPVCGRHCHNLLSEHIQTTKANIFKDVTSSSTDRTFNEDPFE